MDEVHIKFVFENVVDDYFEYFYLFNGDSEKRETLFPELTYQELMQKFDVKNPLREEDASYFNNIVLVKMKNKIQI